MTNALPAETAAEVIEESAPIESTTSHWRVVEPTNPSDSVPHEEHLRVSGNHGWALIGASRRGKSHAHDGTYREDAFEVEVVNGWHIVAVADGLGSCSLSRVGSAAAVKGAVAGVAAALPDLSRDNADAGLRAALKAGLEKGLAEVVAESERCEVALRELSTTLLLLLHRVEGASHTVAAAQVGDGLLAAWQSDGSVLPLAEGLQGEYGAQVVPLTGKGAVERALGQAQLFRFESEPRLLLAMTDGVADDFFPPEEHLPKLLEHLLPVCRREDADAALLELLRYEKRGSFDDRTLVMLCPPGIAVVATSVANAEVAATDQGVNSE